MHYVAVVVLVVVVAVVMAAGSPRNRFEPVESGPCVWEGG